MTIATHILNVLDDGSLTRNEIIARTKQPPTDVDLMLQSLTIGCYIIKEGGQYRISTKAEQSKWAAQS